MYSSRSTQSEGGLISKSTEAIPGIGELNGYLRKFWTYNQNDHANKLGSSLLRIIYGVMNRTVSVYGNRTQIQN